MSSDAFKEAAINHINKSRRKDPAAEDEASEAKGPPARVSDDQLALVDSKYLKLVEDAGFIVVDVTLNKKTKPETLVGIEITDPGGNTSKFVYLNSDGEEGRLKEAIHTIQLNLTRDARKAARAVPKRFAALTEELKIKIIGELEAKAAAKAAAKQSSAKSGKHQRVKGLPQAYYDTAREVGVVIGDPKRGPDKKLQSVAISDDRKQLNGGSGPNQKTYEFKGGYIPPKVFDFKPGQPLNDPEQIKRFREVAQGIATIANKTKQESADWAAEHREAASGMTEVRVRKSQRSSRRDAKVQDAFAPAT